MPDRPLPWTDIVAALGEERFARLKESLAQANMNELDRDAFLLNAAAGDLLRDLVPEAGPAEAITAYGSLLHMLYLGWSRAWPLVKVDADELRAALESPFHLSPPASHLPLSPLSSLLFTYIQLPERLVWAEPEPGSSHEPVDGLFVIARPTRLTALAVLGFRPGREGFTTIEADAPIPLSTLGPRADGSGPFASVLPGGNRAHLFSVASAQELAALALLALGATETGEGRGSGAGPSRAL